MPETTKSTVVLSYSNCFGYECPNIHIEWVLRILKYEKTKNILSKYSATRNLGRVASEDPIELYDFDQITLSLHLVEKHEPRLCQ